MDLTVKLCTLPFTEFKFYFEDYLECIADTDKEKDRKPHFKKIHTIVHKSQRIYNLDQVNLLISKFYPHKKLDEYYKKTNSISGYYLEIISRLSKAFITHRNGSVALKYWESEAEEELFGPYKGINKVALWNSFNRMFTTDLLAVSYLLDNEMEDERFLKGYYSQLMLADIQLENTLKKGVAENHLHAGAGINFYIKWQDLMNLTDKNEDDYKRELFNDHIIDKHKDLHKYVMVMALVRMVMADYLQNNSDNQDFYKDYVKKLKCVEKNQDDEYEEPSPTGKYVYDLIDFIYHGKEVELGNILNRFQDIKRELGIMEEEGDEPLRKDIISHIFKPYKAIDTVAENILLFKALRYMKANGQDIFFSKVFWQYIRVKNEVFQCDVQGNLIRGLDNFQNYYYRSTEVDYSSDVDFWKMIIKNQMQNKNLKKLELRTSPGMDKSKNKTKKYIKKILRAFFQVYKELLEEERERFDNVYIKHSTTPTIGIVFHFIKALDEQGSDKCWQNYNNTNNNELYFRELQNQYKQQAAAINELRETIPYLSEYIVGIDAASLENNTEPWVFAPIYEEIRNSNTNKLINLNTDMPIKHLGFTFHSGEDYRHLLTGLRRIDEVIEHFKFHAGDRIGHGIALGADVERWIDNNRVIILPRLEHLENLLWLWGLYKYGKSFDGFDVEYLERSIMEQAKKIYIAMEGITVYNLWEAYRNKFKVFEIVDKYKSIDVNVDKSCIREIFCINANSQDKIIWNEEKLTHAQHCKCYLERMLEPIQLEIKREDKALLEFIQQIVTTKISREGIVVETNPTSNTAIGEIDNIYEHYVYRLNSRGLNGDANVEGGVIVTINSDDPSVFNTNVSNELSYIFYSLLEKGYAREDALAWIDRVRDYGMKSSFVDDRELRLSERIEEISRILEALK